jgi:hypothetical protein
MSPADPLKAAAKKKRDILITSVLLAIFAFTFTKNVILYKRKAPVASAPAAQETESTVQSMTDQLVYVTNLRVYDAVRDEQKKVWESEWGRDPFLPQARASSIVKAVNLTLKGILWDDLNPKAIVNEKSLLKGEAIYGYTVVDIKPRSVVLRTGEKNIELYVFRPVSVEAPAAT